MNPAEPAVPVDRLRLARNRIKKVLREHLLVASARTLETKLAERGPNWMQRACAPHIVTTALKQLLTWGDLTVVAGPGLPGLPECPCKLFTLAESNDPGLGAALDYRVYLETLYNQHSSRAHDPADSIGRVGEDAVRRALEILDVFIIGHSWGDVKDPRIAGASDGLVYSCALPTSKSGILVEVKNKREWIYHEAFEVWKHIRNAYAMDCIPLLFSRRIHEYAFQYVMKRVGGLAVEVRAQFAPPELEEVLADVVDPDGLDYFDLRFTGEPGPRFLMRSRAIAAQVVPARQRMETAAPIVAPYLDELAAEGVRGQQRSLLYWKLQADLNAAGIEPISLLPQPRVTETTPESGEPSEPPEEA